MFEKSGYIFIQICQIVGAICELWGFLRYFQLYFSYKVAYDGNRKTKGD